MLIKHNGNIAGEINTFKNYAFGEVSFFLNGLLYLDGCHAGEESINLIKKNFISEKTINFDELRGSFLLVIKLPDQIIAFTDNSNMHCIYYSNTYISNSCIEIVSAMKKDNIALSLNDNAIYQQFSFGKVFGEKTYINEVSFTDSMHYIVVKDGKIIIKNKNIGDISSKSRQLSMINYLESFAHSIEKEKVACALTGGYDSRMIFSVINNIIKADCTIAGNNLKEKDIQISKKVAEVANAKWKLIEVEKPNVTDMFLREMFKMSDGMEMYISTFRFRWVQYVNYLKSQEYTICLSGDGGVLHKDWEWKQDFPFYHKNKTNLKRYFSQRIACQQNMNNAGEKLLKLIKPQEEWFIAQLKKFQKPVNTESYDMFYNYLNGNRRFEYNLCDGKTIFYAPLQEQDIVRFSYHLPRKDRSFYKQNRMVITLANKNIAKLPTNYGTNASDMFMDKCFDILFEVKYMFVRAFRLIYRRLTKKTIGVQQATTWSCKEDIQQNLLSRKAITWAKKEGYLKESVNISSLGEKQIGVMIYAYLWNEIISNRESIY